MLVQQMAHPSQPHACVCVSVCVCVCVFVCVVGELFLSYL